MKHHAVTTALLGTACLFAAGSNAQLIPFFFDSDKSSPSAPHHTTQTAATATNNPAFSGIINPKPQAPMADPSAPSAMAKPPSNNAIILSDVLGSQARINIFAGFTRDIDTVSSRLENRSKNSTILAPLNSAIQDLPRKPWEDPADYQRMGDQAYKGDEGRGRAYENLRRFTEAHVVPVSPWEEGKENKVRRVAGGEEIWWERDQKDGKVRIMPAGVEVEGVVNRVDNGEVWVLKEVLNYEI